MTSIKRFLKSVVPARILNIKRARAARKANAPFAGMDSQAIFSAIYQGGHWGQEGPDGFSSGDGSHLPSVILPYIEAVTAFLQTLGRPNVVDLGCGDFNVGRMIRPVTADYIACDIVPALIERNKTVFHDMNVDFRCVNIATDPIPKGDVVMVRQVLQHLSNMEVTSILLKLIPFRYAIITEHIPAIRFKTNVDKPTGVGTRLSLGSGLDLSKPPFNMASLKSDVLCSVQDTQDTKIVTTLYRFS